MKNKIIEERIMMQKVILSCDIEKYMNGTYKEVGGTAIGKPPFTGNGFTKTTNGQVIPEYKCFAFIKVNDGAQLIEAGKDGTETVLAIYNVDFDRFIPVEN